MPIDVMHSELSGKEGSYLFCCARQYRTPDRQCGLDAEGDLNTWRVPGSRRHDDYQMHIRKEPALTKKNKHTCAQKCVSM